MKRMDPKKGFCNFFLCFLIFGIIAGIGIGAKFGSRIPEVMQKVKVLEREGREKDLEIQRYYREKEIRQNKKEYGKEDDIKWKNIITLTRSDYIYLGCILIIFWILLCIYWLYTTVYVVLKAVETGANAWVFGILTLVTNVFGVVCLWIYIKCYYICPQCGKLQSRKANYCTICGSALYESCQDCGSKISANDKFCGECGKKLHD